MRGKLQLPQLWESAKYISWPHSHDYPIVRVPTPSGHPESRTFRRQPGESEYDLFERCEAYRDQRGPAIWGERRWRQLVDVEKRSVAKHRADRAGPITGVNHEERPGRPNAWVALWYERLPDGSTRRHAKAFRYGTSSAAYATSEQAMAAAIEKREEEERRWYSTLGKGCERQANRE